MVATHKIPNRKYLVDALYEALPQLEKAYIKEMRGRNLAGFLLHAVTQYATEETLIKIMSDIQLEMKRLDRAGVNAHVTVPRMHHS